MMLRAQGSRLHLLAGKLALVVVCSAVLFGSWLPNKAFAIGEYVTMDSLQILTEKEGWADFNSWTVYSYQLGSSLHMQLGVAADTDVPVGFNIELSGSGTDSLVTQIRKVVQKGIPAIFEVGLPAFQKPGLYELDVYGDPVKTSKPGIGDVPGYIGGKLVQVYNNPGANAGAPPPLPNPDNPLQVTVTNDTASDQNTSKLDKSSLRVSDSSGFRGDVFPGDTINFDAASVGQGLTIRATAGKGQKFIGWTQAVSVGPDGHTRGEVSCGAESCSPFSGVPSGETAKVLIAGRFVDIGKTEITFKKEGTGSVALTKTEPGQSAVGVCVNCANGSIAEALPGTELVYKATPGEGMVVRAWSGCTQSTTDKNRCTLTVTESPATVMVQFDTRPPNFFIKEISPKGGTTKVTYTTPTGTPKVVYCTGGVCTGLPNPLPLNTKVTLEMRPGAINANKERLAGYKWGGACSGKKYTDTCGPLTITESDTIVEVEFRTQVEVLVRRADTHGEISVRSSDGYEGTATCDDSNCPVGTNIRHWFFKGKQIKVTAKADPGYTFAAWENSDNACSGSISPECSISLTKYSLFRAVFKEFNYRLVVAKDCNPADSGKVGGTDLYCGTAKIEIEVNGVIKKTLGGTVLKDAVEGLRGGLDNWKVIPTLLQGSKFVPVYPKCVALAKTQLTTTYFDCRLEVKSGGGYLVYVTDRVTGKSAYSRITEMGLTYHPRADYDVNPFPNFLQYGPTTPATPTTDTFEFALDVPKQAPIVSIEDVASTQSSLVGSLQTVVERSLAVVRTLGVTLAKPVQSLALTLRSGAERILAAVGLGSADLRPYDLYMTPKGAATGMPVQFFGSVGNIGTAAFSGMATSTLTVDQNVNGVWMRRATSRRPITTTPAQQFAFVGWDVRWVPATPGEYRMRFCVNSSAGSESSTANNCSYYTRFTIYSSYTPPPSPAHSVVVESRGGGSITSTSDSSDANFTACTTTCTGSFKTGSTVTLTATPAAGNQFLRWEGISAGQCVIPTGSPNKCQLTVNSYKGIVAVFQSQDALTLCGDADRSGKVTSTDANLTGQYAVGTKVDINAKNADANGDGKVTSTDASLILKASVGTAKLEIVNGRCKATVL